MASIISQVMTRAAPEAVGPYSQAIRCGSLLFVSGQLGLDPKTGDFVSKEVDQQTHQCLKNMGEVLEAGGSNLSHVLKTTVMLTSMQDFPKFNASYEETFSQHKPAREALAAVGLPKNALVEISCIAHVPE